VREVEEEDEAVGTRQSAVRVAQTRVDDLRAGESPAADLDETGHVEAATGLTLVVGPPQAALLREHRALCRVGQEHLTYGIHDVDRFDELLHVTVGELKHGPSCTLFASHGDRNRKRESRSPLHYGPAVRRTSIFGSGGDAYVQLRPHSG
jgi:hypothetical protein